MANFVGITSSKGIKLTPRQKGLVDKLLEKYQFCMEDINLGDDSDWGIWGYDWLDIMPVCYRYNGERELTIREEVLVDGILTNTIREGQVVSAIPDGLTTEQIDNFTAEPNYDAGSDLEGFFDALSKILNKNQKLVVHCIGNEKCRFPLSAMQITVQKNNVEFICPLTC